MTVSRLSMAGYRSIHKIDFPLRRVTVLVGSNGVGKTNLYKALHLIHCAALGTLAEELAREGGLGSVLWAGARKTHEQPRLTLSVDLDDMDAGPGGYQIDLGLAPSYEIDIGIRQPTAAAFPLEAQIKTETLFVRQGQRRLVLMERKGPSVWARDDTGARILVDDNLLASETALSRLRGGYPEIDALRETLAAWRFYHGFRTDAASPLRRPGLAVTTPMLAADGANLAAVFATLRFIREDTADLDRAIADAFPGARLVMDVPQTSATLGMVFPDLPRRVFGAHELSDGTLQFLALLGALLSYRLPPFIALNEPETSLHPDLLPALARVIAKAAERSQIWVVTHSRILADALATETGALPRTVIRKDGNTWLEGLTPLGEFEED